MRLLVINPNSTASMTEKIGIAARGAASAGTEIVAVNPAGGPVSIEGYYDEALSVPGLLHVIQTTPGFDAVIIALKARNAVDVYRRLIWSGGGQRCGHGNVDLGWKLRDGILGATRENVRRLVVSQQPVFEYRRSFERVWSFLGADARFD